MNHTIITAGGSGRRMGSDVPKQFLPLCGKPVLMHTIEAFAPYAKIILTLPEAHIEYWKQLCKKHAFTVEHRIVAGGSERFFSVKNALDTIDGEGLVAVQDGVRPFASPLLIESAFKAALEHGSAIPVVPVTDSLRQTDGDGSKPIDRSKIVAVQTPQVFDLKKLKEAYEQAFSPAFTDDASVFEIKWGSVFLVEGEKYNLKITTPQDMKLAEFLMELQ